MRVLVMVAWIMAAAVMMLVIMAVIVIMIVATLPGLVRVFVLHFVVMPVAIGVDDLEVDRFAGLQIDESSLGLVRAAARRTHSSHLHLFDLDFITAKPLQVAATTRAGCKRLIEHDVAAAIAAPCQPRNVVDLELRSFDDRALAAQFETEPDRIGQDERVLADLDQHPLTWPPGAVRDDLDDLLCDTWLRA